MSTVTENESNNDVIKKITKTFRYCCYCGEVGAVEAYLKTGISIDLILRGFLDACQNGHAKVVGILLKAHQYFIPSTDESIKLNPPSICNIILHRHTPLLAACWEGNFEVVDLLLKNGGDCELCDDQGVTPLMAASAIGRCDIVNRLLSHHQDNEYLHKQTKHGYTALFYAASFGHKEAAAKLITPVSINMRGASLTPLMAACMEGHDDVVQLLLEHSGHPDEYVDDEGNTPLLLACLKGRAHTVKLLLKAGASRIRVNARGNYAIMIACETRNINVLEELQINSYMHCMHASNKEGKTPLMAAAGSGNMKIAQLIIDNNSQELNRSDKSGNTALMYACLHGHDKMVSMLIERGAKVLIWSQNNGTPLLISSLHGYKKVVEILLHHGASVDISDDNWLTPLMAASRKGWFDIAYLLIQAGASATAKDCNGDTAITMANKSHTCMLHLLQTKEAIPVTIKCEDYEIQPQNIAAYKEKDCEVQQKNVPYLSNIPEGYIIGCGTEFCCILLPKGNLLKIKVDKISGSLFPALKKNEDLCTSAVELQPEGLHFDSSHPCIIVFPFDNVAEREYKNGTFDLICGNKSSNNTIEWKAVDPEVSNVRVDDGSISVSTVCSGLLAVKYSTAPEVPYISGLPPGYAVRIGTEFCCILLPNESQDKVRVKKISDNWHPELEVNEELCTSAVELKPEILFFDDNCPCIIVFPFDNTLKYNPEKGTFELICGKLNEDNTVQWKPVDTKESNIIVDDKCIYVSSCHSGLFAVKYIENPEIPISIYQSQVPDGYNIKYETEFCCIILPQEIHKDVQADEIIDESLFPILKKNESLCTSVVALKPNNITFDSDKPCIIILSLIKTWEKDETMSTYIPINGHSSQINISIDWKPMDPSRSKCTVGNKSVSISIYHTGLFAVKHSAEYPASTTHINSNEESSLTVPELNNFQLEITDSCVEESNKDLEIKSTVHFCDDSYNSSEIYAAATACVKFEPHGQKFKRPLQVVVPVPDYDKIIAEYPDIKMNVWYSQNSTSKEKSEAPINWRILHGSNIKYVDGEDSNGHPCKLAKFEIEHFSWYQINFDKLKEPFKKLKAGAEFAYNQVFRKPKLLKMRMKAMMTQPSKDRDFSMVVVFYRFHDPLESQKTKYPYRVAFDDEVELNEGSFQILLIGKRFADGDKQEVQKEGILKRFSGNNISKRFDFILELKPTCPQPLTKEHPLGQVKLIQKEVDEREYTLFMEAENETSPLPVQPSHNDSSWRRLSYIDRKVKEKETFNQLLTTFNLQNEILDQPCQDEILLRDISKLQRKEWKECATRLGLSANVIEDKKDENRKEVEEQRFQILCEWKQKGPFVATYSALIEAFISVARTDIAEYVCEFISQNNDF